MGATAAAGLIGGIVYVTEKMKAQKAALAQANLEAHFGNIALSMDEVNDAARRIADDGNFSKLEQAVASFAKTDEYVDGMKSDLTEIEKMNWKVSVGMELTDDEKSAYQRSIEEFINQSNEALTQQRYSLNLALNVLGLEGSDTSKTIDKLFSGKEAELAELGKQLQDEVNNAFEDGLLEIDEIKAIENLQKQIASITEKMTTAEFESKLDVIRLKSSGAQLTPESYQELQEQVNEAIKEASEGYEKEYIELSKALRVSFDEELISQEELDNGLAELQDKLNTRLSDLQLNAADFGLSTIADTFGEEEVLGLNNLFGKMREEIAIQIQGYKDGDGDVGRIGLNDLVNIDTELDETTKANLAQMYENLKPQEEQLQQIVEYCKSKGKEIPESIAAEILSIESIGAISGNIDSLYRMVGAIAAEDNPEYLKALEGYKDLGFKVPETITQGADLNKDNLIKFTTALAQDSAKSFDDTSKPLFIGSGSSVVDGAVKGVNDNSARYVNAIVQMAIEGNRAFDRTNKVNSPSKLYERSAGFIPEGAALGVQRKSRLFSEAIAKMAESGSAEFAPRIEEPSFSFEYFGAKAGARAERENPAGAGIDYERLAHCMVNALNNVAIECDKRQFGRLVSEVT